MKEKIFFRRLGRGIPVILIHGFCETHEIWSGFDENLSEKLEVFVIDLPGFGKSPISKIPFSINDIGAIILDWISQFKIAQPVVIGHSLGGYVALAMASQAPEEIGGLGLFHSTAFPDTDEKKTNRSRVIEFVKTNGKDPFINTFVPGLFFDKKHAAIRLVDKIARRTSTQTLLTYTAAMRDRTSSIEFIRNYAKPVLVLAGEKDSIIPVETARELEMLAPKVILHVLKETGHMAMYERTEEAQNIVKDFVLATRGAV